MQLKRVLMGPGPSDVDSRVLEALSRPTVGHLDPVFVDMLNEIRGLLQYLFRTKNRMTLAMSGTGSAGMETAVVNLIEPGDPMLVCINGVFGGRMADVARRAGAEVSTIEVEWGKVFEPDQIRDAIDGSGMSRYRICKEVGMDESTMSRFMSRQHGLSLDKLDRIADLLALDVVSRRKQRRGKGR